MWETDPEIKAIIADEKMTDIEMASYLIRFINYAGQLKDPQRQANLISLTRNLAEQTFKKITNPYARKLLTNALKKLERL